MDSELRHNSCFWKCMCMPWCKPKTLHTLQAWTVHWEIISCREKQKELTVSRTQISETQNKTNRVDLSSCTLPNFEKRAAKTFYHGDQKDFRWWRICRGRGGGGINIRNLPVRAWTLTSQNGSFRDLRKPALSMQMDMDAHGSSSDRINWPLTSRDVTLFEMHANGRSDYAARPLTCLKAVSVPSRSLEGECICHMAGLRGITHTTCLLFLTKSIWSCSTYIWAPWRQWLLCLDPVLPSELQRATIDSCRNIAEYHPLSFHQSIPSEVRLVASSFPDKLMHPFRVSIVQWWLSFLVK